MTIAQLKVLYLSFVFLKILKSFAFCLVVVLPAV